MARALLVVVLLPALALAREGGGPFEKAARAAEGTLAALELDPADAAARDAAVCAPGAGIDSAVPALAVKEMPRWAAVEHDALVRVALGYYQCRAYALHDRKVCAPMKAFALSYDPGSWVGDPDGGAHWDLACFGRMNELGLVRSYITRNPGFEALCAPSLAATQEFEEQEFAGADLPKVCRLIAEQGRRPEKACAALKRLYLHDDEADKCVPMLRRLQGDAGACASGSEEAAERCRAFAAFRRAYEGKGGPKACGDEPLCRALMGEGPEACAPYAARFKDLFCAPRAALLARAAAQLRDAADTLPEKDAAASDRLKALQARLARLRER